MGALGATDTLGAAPVAGLQIFSVLSTLPLTTALLSGLKAQQSTCAECPLRVRFSVPARQGAPQSPAHRGLFPAPCMGEVQFKQRSRGPGSGAGCSGRAPVAASQIFSVLSCQRHTRLMWATASLLARYPGGGKAPAEGHAPRCQWR